MLINYMNNIKIFSWNSHLSFNKEKQEFIFLSNKKVDIFIIQECKKSEYENIKNNWLYSDFQSEYNGNKIGIAIFSNKYAFKIFEDYNSIFRLVIPYKIKVDEKEILLFAIHTKNKNQQYPYDYNDNITAAMFYYNKYIKKYSTILIGDFNSYDRSEFRDGCHLLMLEKFKEYNIINCSLPNKEFTPTYFYINYKNNTKYYGVNDYCFIKGIKCNNFFITKETRFSDHFPIIVDLKVE
jgi:exonuclease III